VPLVLFDLDDTLFDHTLTLRAALIELRRHHPFLRRRPLTAMATEYERLIGVTHPEVALGRRSSEDARAHRFMLLAEWSGRTLDPATAAALSNEYRANYQRLRRPVPGASEFVEELRGRTRVGVVTNNTLAEQREKLRYLGLDRSVEMLVTSEEIGAQKPDPAIFRAALDRAGVGPESAVMIGDVWASDVAGARSAGIRPIWFNRFGLAAPERVEVPQFASFAATQKLERFLRSPDSPA
jgi:5'-nucleotidase